MWICKNIHVSVNLKFMFLQFTFKLLFSLLLSSRIYSRCCHLHCAISQSMQLCCQCFKETNIRFLSCTIKQKLNAFLHTINRNWSSRVRPPQCHCSVYDLHLPRSLLVPPPSQKHLKLRYLVPALCTIHYCRLHLPPQFLHRLHHGLCCYLSRSRPFPKCSRPPFLHLLRFPLCNAVCPYLSFSLSLLRVLS